jgi:methylenetetrahydrofolate dehydrogenase (NADP+)/methenyltetrahydrofolate cyclohydrolase
MAKYNPVLCKLGLLALRAARAWFIIAPFARGDFVETRIIDGNALGKRLRQAMSERVARLAATGTRPGLAVIIVGDDPASKIYVRNKVRACAEIGMHSEHIELPATASQAEVLERIVRLNADPAIHGILVQLPLPKQISGEAVLNAIAPEKDADGFHPVNVGLLATGHPRFVPCTPAGVMAMLEDEGINPWGQNAVIVGGSNIVGKPAALLLLQKGATVTICNSKTRDLASHTRNADILVVATGKANLVRADMVKPGAVVIDVGMNRTPEGKLCGDVDFQGMLGKVSHITPVPGGVGPMTITMLLANTVQAAEKVAAG